MKRGVSGPRRRPACSKRTSASWTACPEKTRTHRRATKRRQIWISRNFLPRYEQSERCAWRTSGSLNFEGGPSICVTRRTRSYPGWPSQGGWKHCHPEGPGPRSAAMGRNSILASGRARCPLSVVGANRSIDGHHRARSDGISPHRCGEIGEYH